MPNRSTDALFQLVKSLEKHEKRNFKLYVTRNSATDDLKIIQLFDAIDKMPISDVGKGVADTARSQEPKRVLLATVDDDSTVVYYIVHDGIVKPRQN